MTRTSGHENMALRFKGEVSRPYGARKRLRTSGGKTRSFGANETKRRRSVYIAKLR
jgi:hypothetical protein